MTRRTADLAGARAIIVVGLGYGDEGKGATVDALAAGLPRVSAVVRWNGGAQAAHTVCAPSSVHTFSQFGSGTLAGVPTHLDAQVAVEPIMLAEEGRRLQAVGVRDPWAQLTVDARALLTTPVHVAANRAREDARGTGRHGSCGKGVGESRWYHLARRAGAHPGDLVGNLAVPGPVDAAAVRVGDCRRPRLLRRKLDALIRCYAPLIEGSGHGHPSVAELVALYREFAAAVRIVDADHLGVLLTAGTVIFEGAQGVLLDEWRGFHPHTTWSTTTPNLLRSRLTRSGIDPVVLGVLRSYQTRHGAGPLPTEDPTLTPLLPERHNATGRYQGAWRVGHLDLVMLKYAVRCCGGVDGLALTHLDAPDLPVADLYRDGHAVVTALPLGRHRDLTHQGRLTDLLARCTPVLRDVADLPGLLARQVGAPVLIRADGPTRAHRSGTGHLDRRSA